MGKKLHPEHMTMDQLLKYVERLESGCVAPLMVREWAYDNLSEDPVDLRHDRFDTGVCAEKNGLYIHKDGKIYRALESGDIQSYQFPPNGFRWEGKWKEVGKEDTE